MSPQYLQLAAERSAAQCAPHHQPEEFGYEFTSWVSPYTKGANVCGGVALVLQDWASAEGLAGGPRPEVQLHGRMPTLLTNRRLEALLSRVLGLKLTGVYATNVYPFVKSGNMSASLRSSEVLRAARRFAIKELELAHPKLVLALGGVAHATLAACSVKSVKLPHPAARIGGLAAHESAWRAALEAAGEGHWVRPAGVA